MPGMTHAPALTAPASPGGTGSTPHTESAAGPSSGRLSGQLEDAAQAWDAPNGMWQLSGRKWAQLSNTEQQRFVEFHQKHRKEVSNAR